MKAESMSGGATDGTKMRSESSALAHLNALEGVLLCLTVCIVVHDR